MGYVYPIPIQETYILSDDLIGSSDSAVTKGGTANYQLFKSIYRIKAIYSRVKLRVKYTVSCTGIENISNVFRNGIAIGTERNTGSTPTTYSEDFSFLDFAVGDELQIWMKEITPFPNSQTVTNFRIYGISSDFIEV
jgi:hypothetical protein